MKPAALVRLAFASLQVLGSGQAWGQNENAGENREVVQTVRGVVVEKETQYPLPGATILWLSDSSRMTGSVSDAQGHFKLEEIPPGHHRFLITFVGYRDVLFNNVMVRSGKETVLTVFMEEAPVSLSEVTVTARRDGDVSNEMAPVSARSFTIEETERYAGSRGDPARMASNFAGVQGADDSRNDIVIRGNSPQAVLWRMEGLNIPNPNHFNIPGTAGGPVCMINNKILANSDFYTGAFPAEFGNSVSGVFDLKLRDGNNTSSEYSGQLGFLGTEFFAEGPLTGKHTSSYLASYRYSTLSIFNKVGIDIGTEAVPRYQDVAVKLSFPTKRHGKLTMFALGGASQIDILISDQVTPSRNIYGENDRDQYFTARTGVSGVSYQVPISSTSFLAAAIGLSSERVGAYHELVYRHLNAGRYEVDSLTSLLHYSFQQSRASANIFYARKAGRNGYFNAGVNADEFLFDFVDSVRNIEPSDPSYYTWRRRWDTRDHAALIQPFIQWKYSGPRVELVAGVHTQYFTLSRSLSIIEPRMGMKMRGGDHSWWTAGLGMHSQIQQPYLYFYSIANDIQGKPFPHNQDMDFTRSLHAVVGYEWILSSYLRLKTEAYYQRLSHVPVEKRTSSFSLLNTGAGFSRFFPDTLVNKGTGDNYGFEVTLEKFFSHGYLFLFTGSVFESTYRGSDQVLRDTDFNGNYALNVLFTREWTYRKHNTLAVGGKVTSVGGRRYGPVDEVASAREREVVYYDATANSLQFRPYFRADLRVTYRLNRPHAMHEWAIDLVNIFNTTNALKLTYAPNDADPTASPIRVENQLGFLPIFYYRIDF